CLKVLEALCDFDKLGSQPLWGNVVLAKNTQRGTDLALIKVEFVFELCNHLLLRFRKVGSLSDECSQLFRGDADVDSRARNTAANRDPTSIRFNLLSIDIRIQPERLDPEGCNEAQMVLHDGRDTPSLLPRHCT